MDLLEIELYRQTRPSCYGEYYDDDGIEKIVWSEIGSSTSKADFICYLLHGLQGARHEGEARARIKAMKGDAAGTPAGYVRAIEHIRGLAMQGVPDCMFHMGKFHLLGIGVKRDFRLARMWYQEAIDAGEMRAHCDMGWLYLHGGGDMPQDSGEAFRLLFTGAQKGIPAARASVGMMLMTGNGVPSNAGLGLNMLHTAFDSGYSNAGNLLADMYFEGTHVDRDIGLAHDWLFRVASRGDARTMAILGHYLVTGSHGRQDVAQGISLLHDATAREYIFAYLWLGNLYKDGNGVERDTGKAMEWFRKGASAGNEGCGLALLRLLHEAKPDAGQNSSSAC